ncbi:MAG: 3-oxo-5-alpha-steroid 4-dehydrogenase 1 [Myxococcota bacterium]|jgi:3-oxo-5-alpha-steroid 4-dehydrogenase 1
MTELAFYNWVIIAWLVFAVGSFIALQFIAAPYGRHVRDGWGPMIDARAGWIIMESPTLIVFDLCWLFGTHAASTGSIILAVLWHLHYINRTLIFPFRMRGKRKQMPVSIMGSAIFFNLGNGYLQGRWVFEFSGGYEAAWLTSPAFIIGLLIFAAGYWINLQSDSILRNLRKPGESGYKVPKGGFYRFVSAPNYMGEIIEWIGWAVATWSVAGLTFAVFTFGNLGPRAKTNHQWYLDKFPDYPKERRALIPFVW